MRPDMELGYRKLGFARALIALALSAAIAPHVAHAQATGTVAGTVTERDGKTPISFAQIAVIGGRGTSGEENGTFLLRGVPVGTRTLKVMEVGYDPAFHDVLVRAGETTFVKIRMETKIKTFEEIKVIGRPTIDTHSSQTEHSFDAEIFKLLSVDNVMDATALQSGVVSEGGQLHVRGGRGDELKERFNGIEV